MNAEQARERAAICEWQDHEWREDYYGDTCQKCGLFVPDNSYDPLDDDGYDDEQYWTCELCGGEYWDGGTSCQCPVEET